MTFFGLVKNFTSLLKLVAIFPMLLLTLKNERHAPITTDKFKDEYDYIVVGGGSAGSVMASRLSEMPCVSVLLLEAVGLPPLLSEIPSIAAIFVGTDYDWQFISTPQRHIGSALVKGQVPIPSGRSLGGSSVINDMIANRANRHNYDNWAKHGAKGWSYREVLPYFLKLENETDPMFLSDGFHGTNGPMTISTPDYQPLVKSLLMKAAKGEGFKFVDPNAGTQHGFYDIRATMRNGQRCSTTKAYLVPSENRTNLDIVSKARVTKIDIQNKQAVGVYFDFDSTQHYVKAKREIIISAGAYNTPKLLMLSGIGPSNHLNKVGIPVVADLPVGSNLHDHCGSLLVFEVNDSVTPLVSRILDETNVQRYIDHRSGPLNSLYGVNLVAFLSSNSTAEANDIVDNQVYFIEAPTFAALSRGMKPEIYFRFFAPYAGKPLLMCMSQIVAPQSRGCVRLRSSDPYDPPKINLNFFKKQQDLEVAIKGYKTCLKIVGNTALSKIEPKMINLTYPGCEIFSGDLDNFLGCLTKAFPIAASHHSGTAKMGDPSDKTTVVDSELRVKTISGLRVIDASVMPTIPTGNINIPTIMIAEKASDLIKMTISC